MTSCFSLASFSTAAPAAAGQGLIGVPGVMFGWFFGVPA